MAVSRYLQPRDILLPSRYSIEVWASNLNVPGTLLCTPKGDMYLTDVGIIDGNGKILKYTGKQFEVIAEGFLPPVTGVTWHEDGLYVSERSRVTVLQPSGNKQTILYGLPSSGDHHNNQVVFGPDGKMYFGQGTATNSGVVGIDNTWVRQHPLVHDMAGQAIRVTGESFASEDLLAPAAEPSVYTGAFVPFGVKALPHQKVYGVTRASGSILRCNPDGSNLELIAWGLRNPYRLAYDTSHRLLCLNHGMDERGSRPIADDPDALYAIQSNSWYGWPDYCAGEPVTLPKFRSGDYQPNFLLETHPMRPPKPFAAFEPHSAVTGLAICRDGSFSRVGDIFVSEFGSEAPETTGGKPLPRAGRRVVKIHPVTGRIKTFALNRNSMGASESGLGGFERLMDLEFGPQSELFIVDGGITSSGETFIPNTGVIWRVCRK